MSLHPPGSLLPDVKLDRLEFSKFLYGKAANFTTLPAFFKSAERKFRVALQKRVYPDGACSNPPAGRQRRVEVARPYTRGQPVIRAIGDLNCFLSRIEGQD